MSDQDRFEARLATALERYASEAPTTVDAAAVARAVATGDSRTGWLDRLAGGLWPTARQLQLARLGQGALAVVVLVVLGVGALAVAQRMQPAPIEGAAVGRMVCGGSPWIAGETRDSAVSCRAELLDPALRGTIRITLAEAGVSNGLAMRSGSIELRSERGTWSGRVWITGAPNGMLSGDAALSGQGSLDGQALELHLISSDGITWGLIGSGSGRADQ